MSKLLLTILLFSFLQTKAQYTANWTGWGHTSYEVQQGLDSSNWTTIGTVNGQLALNNYQFPIPGPTYYYRIKADHDSSQAILVPEVLSIKTPPPAHGRTKKIQSLSVKVMVSGQIHYEIESPRTQQMQYNLYDIAGRRLAGRLINLSEGTNEILDAKPINGIYYASFQGYFDMVTTKIMVQ